MPSPVSFCAENPALRKLYRPLYCWGQLNGWFKQTVNDPTASLSAERRGTISLPDLDSCFGSTKGRGYGPKERAELLEHIERRPDAMWKTGTQWSFKNEAKVYGSPMLDAAWAELTGKPEEDPMPALLEELKNAPVPFKQVLVQPRSRSRGRGRPKKADTFAYIEMSDDEDFF